MDYIQERTKPESIQCSFSADVSTTSNPQDSIDVHIKVRYMSNLPTLSNEGLCFEACQGETGKGHKALLCTFVDYQGAATLSVTCSDDVDSVTLIELALDYIGAGNLKYVVSERYIEVI